MEREVILKRTFQGIGILLFIALLVLIYFLYQGGNLDSRHSVLTYVQSFGLLAPIVYFMLQFIFTVVPGLPNTLILAFGPFFIWDYSWFSHQLYYLSPGLSDKLCHRTQIWQSGSHQYHWGRNL